MRFTDKICIVTGGGSGIGRAACQRFAAEGGKVTVADLNEAHGNETVDLIMKAGGEAIFAKTNVGESAEVRAAIDATVAKWGRIDVIVNDAAMMTFSPLLDLPEDDWDKVMGVNLRSVFLFCKYGVPHMPEGAAIVNISSVHAHETTKNVVPYATSKGGMESVHARVQRGTGRPENPHQLRGPRRGGHADALEQPERQKRCGKGGRCHRQTRGPRGGHLFPGGGRSALHYGHDTGGRRRAAGHSVDSQAVASDNCPESRLALDDVSGSSFRRT